MIDPGHSDLERDMGRLEGRMGAMEKTVQEIHDDTKNISAALNEARGGWKTLLLVAGVAGAAGAILSKFSEFFIK